MSTCSSLGSMLLIFRLHDKLPLLRQGEKSETSTKNMKTNKVAQQVKWFCASYFLTFIVITLFDSI